MRNCLLAILLLFCTLGDALAQSAHDVLSRPIELLGYASGVAIEWQTYNEANVDYFVVLRTVDGATRTVATLEPRGHQDTLTSYRYIDQSAYRLGLAFSLRIVFMDGSFSESELMQAQYAHSRRTRVLSALDSESLARLRISLDSDVDQDVVLRIKSLSGELLDTYHRELSAGLNEVEIDYQGWPAGYYSVELNDSTAQLQWLVHVDPSIPMAKTRRVTPRS